MERKIRIGAVSYLNTKPFIYGLEHGGLKDKVELLVDYPANLVNLLKTDKIDIGLVPVGALPTLGEYHIVSDYCIGTEGEVASVAVFSQVPMDQIEAVYLDYQSRTSVLLCKLLFEKFWKKKVKYIDAADETYIQSIEGSTAGLIIGDRALMVRSKFQYNYDLGLGWKEMTGMPFVFAIWVSLKKIDPAFIGLFNEAILLGLAHVNLFSNLDQPFYDIRHYYEYNLSYGLDEKKKAALETFLNSNIFS